MRVHILFFLLFGIAAVNIIYADEKPKTQYYRAEYNISTNQLLNIQKKQAITDDADAVPAPSGNYSLKIQYTKSGYELCIVIDKEEMIVVAVPEFQHRPIEAHWINEKLVYMEVFFNPHYGFYCIYDVEQEKIIVIEQIHDGTDLLRNQNETSGE